MKRSTKLFVAAAAVAGVAAGGTGLAVAGTTGDDEELPITGPALERASAAALAHTGEGRVTDTEVGDEDSFYEVEVTLENGSEVDVQLDEGFNVVGAEAETSDASGDDD
ncbi:MAG: PepSY domain-containing protein [Acidimicrobiales bacterium]